MSKKPAKSARKSKQAPALHCVECDKVIAAKDEALFVEEDVGRYFCSEPCIVGHFTSDIEKLEREYGKHVSANDLTSEEREKYAHLRWMTLEQPDEVWCEKTVKGDKRHTLIAEFKPDKKTVWAVSICLMLRGDPSFLYLAFVTSDKHLVDVFRKGEKLKVVRHHSQSESSNIKSEKSIIEKQMDEGRPDFTGESDRLAEPWTDADSLRATILKSRGPKDIPTEDFAFYQNCLEETLQEPTELWSYQQKGTKKIYHFIRRYEHDKNYWYVVMAKDTTDETQIEIVDAFPTNDESVVQLCRYGNRESFGNQEEAADATTNSEGRRNVH